MKIKHDELVIDKEFPFANCQLDREKYAVILTKLIETYADGFVLAINNEWGTGKSTFVKMWKQHLENQGYKTIYFNAWEHDFDDKPLPAILSELKTIDADGINEASFKQLVSKVSIFADKALSSALKIVAKQFGADELLQDIIKGSTEGITAILNSEIDEYAKKKIGLLEFKSKLKEYVNSIRDGKPIIFIVDELDRCRPDYSVRVLEQIKHFFSIDGIVFVLSIDKVQLGHAIRGVYGSDQINAEEYLRRFIDVEYSIPEPDTNSFCNYLFTYFEFDKFFNLLQRSVIIDFKYDVANFISTSALLFDKAKLPLRLQEKIFAHARIAIGLFKHSDYLFPDLFIMLAYIKFTNIDFYHKLKAKTLTLESVIDKFYEICPKTTNIKEIEILIFTESLLIFSYNNSLSNSDRKPLTRHIGKSNSTVPIKSKMDTSNDQKLFTSYIDTFEKNSKKINIKIEYLINKLDLVDDIIL